nr:hypothetical protein [Tanacetum cinerariifolium]
RAPWRSSPVAVDRRTARVDRLLAASWDAGCPPVQAAPGCEPWPLYRSALCAAEAFRRSVWRQCAAGSARSSVLERSSRSGCRVCVASFYRLRPAVPDRDR